jgi:hypothetical protein
MRRNFKRRTCLRDYEKKIQGKHMYQSLGEGNSRVANVSVVTFLE